MRITTGTGNRRSTFEFPCAEIVTRSSEEEQKIGLDLLCKLTNVSDNGEARKPIWVVTYEDSGKQRRRYSSRPVPYQAAQALLKAAKEQAAHQGNARLKHSIRVEMAQ